MTDISRRFGNDKMRIEPVHNQREYAALQIEGIRENHRQKEYSLYQKDKLPAPEFIVLYNGVEPMEKDYDELRLSDLFDPQSLAESGIHNLELIVKVYNINKGKNPELVHRIATLNGYEVWQGRGRQKDNFPFGTRSFLEGSKKMLKIKAVI